MNTNQKGTKEVPAFGTWQPIETAPEGKDILVYQPDSGEQFVAYFSLWNNKWMFAFNNALKDEPSHWMPLPEIPKEEEET